MGSFSYETTSYIAYSTLKTAVNRAFNALARELASDGIHVAILSPGWVRTDMGGPNATLSVEDSARGLLHEIARTHAILSGKFRDYAGNEMVW
jgi:NAD(P)-dependent dehydrogenase (short-subunit alcohol dehydrogenase family)